MNYFVEIKNRVFIILSCTLLLIVSQLYYFKDTLLFVILKPNIDQQTQFYLICTNITEGFFSYWYIIWIISLHFFFFFFLIHTCVFFLPGLYKTEKKVFKYYLVIYLVFEIYFVLIFYNIILPYSWNFFYNIFSNKLTQHLTIGLFFEIKINEYLSYFFSLYFICLLISQILFILNIKLYLMYKKSQFKTIKNHRKKFYFLFFIFSTIITPPDVISQIMIGLFLIILLEINIFLIILLNKLN
nr:Sec-independent protein translocase protein [Actinocyclus sp. mgcode 4]